MSTLAGLTFANLLMSFGNYNPGWRCLDPHNGTIHGDNMTTLMDATRDGKSGLGMTYNNMSVINNNVTSQEYSVGDCSVFESCKNVEFNPEATTIVTEWRLVCDKAWIPSFMISLQMGGFLIGSTVAGIMGDMYGRKMVIYVSVMFSFFFNVILAFSNSWQMFAALRLPLGISMSFIGTLYYVYVVEFVTMKWRAIVVSFPCFPIFAALFGVTCFLLKDWYHIHIVSIVVSVITFIPVFWLPESLRWLEVKGKKESFQRVAQKIAKCNGKTLESFELLNTKTNIEPNKPNIKDKFRDILKLFRGKYRKYTIIITLPWFSVSLIYYAITFGVKALSGNLYLNIVLLFAIEIVVDCILMFAPNAFGRKKAGFIFSGFSGTCLLVAAFFEKFGSGNFKFYGVTIPVMFGKVSISAFWADLQVIMVELYPTVARGAANSWGQLITRAGGTLAPLLIPNETSTIFICYAIMGTLGLICAVLLMLLPETKGKALEETFGEKICDEDKSKGTAV